LAPVARAASTLTGKAPLWVPGRLTLFRSRLRGWEGVELSDVPGVTEADEALMNADAQTAVRGYLRRITAEHDDFDAWTGLGLAYAMSGDPAWRPLLRTPELVHALYSELASQTAPPRPAELARWLTAMSR